MLCECGCGRETPLADKTYARRGIRKGDPLRFATITCRNRYNASFHRPKERRWEERDTGYDTPCWIWLLHKQRDGYGVTARPGAQRGSTRTMLAHVRAWEETNGPVPDGHELHHECERRDCVRPEHMRTITHGDHLREHFATVNREAVREARRHGERPAVTMQRLGISKTSYYRAAREDPALRGQRHPPGPVPSVV